MKNSIILWRGPSQLDGQPIRLVLSGLTTPSTNAKTGPVLQTWILLDSVSPADAVRTGHDRGVCGSCLNRHHTGGGCYVLPWQAPTAIWRATQGQPTLAEELSKGRSGGFLQKLESLTTGRTLRVGSYGDPVAVPLLTWQTLIEILRPAHVIGYTHQWAQTPLASGFVDLLRASTTPADNQQALDLGWSTFMTFPATEGYYIPISGLECPASVRDVSCDKCKLCKPTSDRPSTIFIKAHGARKARFS